MSCETAWQEYIDAMNAAVAAAERLRDFSLLFVGLRHGNPLALGGPDSETLVQLDEEAAATERVKREKWAIRRERSAVHRSP